MGALKLALDIHQRILKIGFTFNVMFVNSLMDRYANCERIQKAFELFEKMHDADTILWNAMIVGYTQNIFFIFENMNILVFFYFFEFS